MPRITQAVLRVANVFVDKLERTAGYVSHSWKRNPSWSYELILQLAKSHEGEDRVLAERFLNEAESDGWLVIKRHRYGGIPEKVALVSSDGVVRYESLYALTGRQTPRDRRLELSRVFSEYADQAVYSESWVKFCQRCAAQLDKLDESKLLCRGVELAKLETLLADVFKLLHADDPLHIREASTLYLGYSKKLEANQAVYLKWLSEITEGRITSFDDIGIQDKHRTITLWGNWTLEFDTEGKEICELRHFELPVRISQRDVSAAIMKHPELPVVTVENKESLESWALMKPEALLISSGELGGFSHSAVIEFVKTLPDSARLFHWGDSDPAGFSILASLRERAGREIKSLGMEYVEEDSASLASNNTAYSLTITEQREVTRLLDSEYITFTERATLLEILEAGNKGSFEQEGRNFPTFY